MGQHHTAPRDRKDPERKGSTEIVSCKGVILEGTVPFLSFLCWAG
jgi:hypothetical protein